MAQIGAQAAAHIGAPRGTMRGLILEWMGMPCRDAMGLARTIVLALFLFGAVGPAAAEFNSKAEFAILMDFETRAVLYEKNPDELMEPASMSKLMTLAVVFDALKRGEIRPDTTYPVSVHAWKTGGAPSGTSAMFAPLNKEVSVADLIQGLIVQSGNDAAIVLAEGMEGSEEKFAERMTRHARELGLKKSTFGNPTGLPNPNQLMTVREIAQLAHHLIKDFPEYYRYFSQKAFPYQPEGRKKPYAFYNRNPLLGAVDGADGLKTGYTKQAGYGVVGSAKRGERRLIAVVSGLKSATDRRNEAKKLLELGFSSFTEFKIFDAGEVIGRAQVYGGSQWFVSLVGDGNVRVLLPKFAAKPRIKAWITYDGPLKPPVRRGDRVAMLSVTTQDIGTNEIPLYAAEDVEPAGFMTRGFHSLFHLAFGWVPL